MFTSFHVIGGGGANCNESTTYYIAAGVGWGGAGMVVLKGKLHQEERGPERKANLRQEIEKPDSTPSRTHTHTRARERDFFFTRSNYLVPKRQNEDHQWHQEFPDCGLAVGAGDDADTSLGHGLLLRGEEDA